MRVLSEATETEVRRRLTRGELQTRPRVLRTRRLTLSLIGGLVGLLLGLAYAHRMVAGAEWWIYLLTGLGGLVAGFLLVAIPRFIWRFIARLWLGIALRQYADKSRLLASRAQQHLNERDSPDLSPAQLDNDLAVVACLRGAFPAAAERLRAAHGRDPHPALLHNLLVVLAETQQWEEFARQLEETARAGSVSEDNLARVAALCPRPDLLERLWGLAIERRFPRLMNNLGVRKLRADDLSTAAEAFRLALRQLPSYPPPHVNLGLLLWQERKLGEALAETASAVGLQSRDPVTLNNLGALLTQAGDPRTAHRWLLRALLFSPRSLEIQVNLGNAFAATGRYEQALEEYHAAARAGECPAAHHNAALILFATGQHEQAREQQQQARDCSPHDADTLNNLGCYLWHLERYPEAETCFQEAAGLSRSSQAVGNLVAAEIAASRPEAALELLQDADYDPLDLAFDRGLAHLLFAHRLDPETSATHRKLRSHHLDQASLHFERVTTAGRGPVTEALMNLGLVSYLQADYQSAAEAFAAAMQHSPAFQELLYPTALCYLRAALQAQEQRGEDEILTLPARELLNKARPLLERALEVRQVGEAATYNLGVIYYMLGDVPRAINFFKRAASDPRPEYLNALAVALARRGQDIQKSVTGATLMGEGKRQQILGEARRTLSAALHHFEQVLKLQPHNPFVHANAGLAFMLRNQPRDVERAVQHWQLMRQVGGDWGRRVFDLFSQAMASDQARRLRFQDVEVIFQELSLWEWVTAVPPRLAGLRFFVEDLMDLPEWHFEAYHPLIRRALRYREKASRMEHALQRLAF